jgi:hypothetical protein
MARAWKWLKKEIYEILPVWAFFFVSFGLAALTVSAVLSEYHIERQQPAEYLIGSLIMAKVVLLLDAFLKREWFRGRPLIYITLWNTGLYFVAGLTVHYLEELLKIKRRQHVSAAQAHHEVLRTMAQPGFRAMMVWVLVATFGFCAIRELIRAIGWDHFIEMFFGFKRHSGSDERQAA